MHKEQIDEVFSNWGEENKRQHQAFGERVYDKDFDRVFSAIVTSFSDLGLTVKNMERQSGYILADGPSPLPPEQLRPLAQAACDEINKVATRKWHPVLNNGTRSITITVLRLDDHRVKVKMRNARTQIGGTGTKYYQSYPPILEAEYQCVWRALEKQIFLDENLDKGSK